MKRSNEPVVWLLFGAGGMLSALFGPVLILITGLLVPAGILLPVDAMSFNHMHEFAGHWIGKGIIVAIISLFLWHGMHRIYHSLHDVGVHAGRGMKLACYGVALAATVASAALALAVS
ncbi:MAG: fumarate reductase subunit FrdD [Usitatibacter sp.]